MPENESTVTIDFSLKVGVAGSLVVVDRKTLSSALKMTSFAAKQHGKRPGEEWTGRNGSYDHAALIMAYNVDKKIDQLIQEGKW